MITTAEAHRPEELLREAWALAYALGDCQEQYDLLIEVLDRKGDAMKGDEPEASFAVYEVVLDTWYVLHQLAEAFFALELQLLDRANKLDDEADRQGL